MPGIITRGNWSMTMPARSGVSPSATAWAIMRVTMSLGAALVMSSPKSKRDPRISAGSVTAASKVVM
jgi:hypothetical protein